MSKIRASIPSVPRVTVIPSVTRFICAKSTFEKKAIKKNKVIAKIPAPKGGDRRSGTRLLNP
jgi:hypothetical protein